jgi:hypothetical protein
LRLGIPSNTLASGLNFPGSLLQLRIKRAYARSRPWCDAAVCRV